MSSATEDDFIELLTAEVDKSDKAVQKIRKCLRALKSSSTRSLEQDLQIAETRGTDLVQATRTMIMKAPARSGLHDIEQNEEFQELKASFKKVVSSLNTCTQDIQKRGRAVSYTNDAAGKRIETQDAGDDDDDDDAVVDSGDLELEMVFNSEQMDVDKEIDAENRQDAMRLAQDTVVLKTMMKDTVELIDEQGQQLSDIDQTVETAAETVESATKELEQAREHQKCAQKLKVIVGSVVACVVISIIIGVVAAACGNGTCSTANLSPTTSTVAPTTTTVTPVPPPDRRMLREVEVDLHDVAVDLRDVVEALLRLVLR